MFTTALICMSMLGLTLSRILKAQPEESDVESEEILLLEEEELPAYQQ